MMYEQKILEKNKFLEEKYGSVFVIAAILSIIYHGILLYRLCKKKDEEIYGRVKNLTLRERFLFVRKVRKEFPGLSREQARSVADSMLEELQNMDESEFYQLFRNTNETGSIRNP